MHLNGALIQFKIDLVLESCKKKPQFLYKIEVFLPKFAGKSKNLLRNNLTRPNAVHYAPNCCTCK